MSFTDLDYEMVPVDGGVWFAVGLERSQLDRLTIGGANPQVGEQLASVQHDAVVVLVGIKRGEAVSVSAWRGILAGGELFYTTLDNGTFVFSDHFRNVVSLLPTERRAPSEEALLEHYLTGWTYDRRTPSAGVHRLAVGDRLRIDLCTRDTVVEIFSRASAVDEPGQRSDAVDRVEAALEDILAPLSDSSDVCVTFSGGVDSTLLATFMGDAAPLVAMTTDSVEWEQETQYARVASRMLNRELTEFHVPEHDYLSLLEEAADLMAIPAHHYAMPMLATLYQRPETTFLLGDGADSVFGSGRGMQRVSGAMSNRAGLVSLAVLGHVPGQVGRRARQINGYAQRFAQPPQSMRGEAARSLIFGDTSLIESMVGPDEVDRLLASELNAVLARVDLETSTSDWFARHIELHQWRLKIADLASVDRHLAQARGKRVVMPFVSPKVVSELLRLPPRQRYIKGLAGKWILKEILSRRLPEYRVNQRKNATGIPFERYYREGPLANIWDRYDVPDFIAPQIRDEVVLNPTAVTWYAITHAVWSDRIERNRDLQPAPATLEYRVQIRG